VITALIALIFGSIGLGGGIYETLIVDRVWPGNLAIIWLGRSASALSAIDSFNRGLETPSAGPRDPSSSIPLPLPR
jgi:hypothetical protein